MICPALEEFTEKHLPRACRRRRTIRPRSFCFRINDVQKMPDIF